MRNGTGSGVLTVWSLVVLVCIILLKPAVGSGVYPQGTEFPLALYSIDQLDDMKMVKQFGWNGVHTYGFNTEFLSTWKAANTLGLVPLRGEKDGDDGWKSQPEDEIRKTIAEYAPSQNILWWDIHEERRYWRPNEMALVVNYSEWSRKYDPAKRPNFMYMPGHWTADDVSHYVKYLDVIPASVYTTYALMPHAWVRWRMESTLQGIELAGAKIGGDYLHGEKTPVAILELFHEQYDPKRPPKIMTPEGAYHDFWQCIVSGAQGIMIFSYFHRNDAAGQPTYQKDWETYCKAASQITGREHLGSMILHGVKNQKIRYEIIEGPKRTVEFVPDGGKPPQSAIRLSICWRKPGKGILM